MNKLPNTLKEMRLERGISLADFSSMIGISTSYLCMLEKGGRRVSKEIVNKVLEGITDLSTEEKHRLQSSILEVHISNIKEIQKRITGLTTTFFYKISNGTTEGLEDLANSISELIKQLAKMDITKES